MKRLIVINRLGSSHVTTSPNAGFIGLDRDVALVNDPTFRCPPWRQRCVARYATT